MKISKSIVVLISILYALSGFGQDQNEAERVFNGYKFISVGDSVLLYANFQSGNEPTSVNIVTKDIVSAQEDDIIIGDYIETSDYNKIIVFADHVTVDNEAVSGSTNADIDNEDIIIMSGSFRPESLESFTTSTKDYAGKVDLFWSQDNDAGQYIILRDLAEGDRFYEAIHIVNSGITTTYSDFDIDIVNAAKSYTYYILPCFIGQGSTERYLGMASSVVTSTMGMKFDVFGGNEAYTTIKWEYDNSILQGRELDAVNESIIGAQNGDIFDELLYISEFNLGNSRLQFNSIKIDHDPTSPLDGVRIDVEAVANISAKSTLEFWYNTGQLSSTTHLLLSDPTEDAANTEAELMIGLETDAIVIMNDFDAASEIRMECKFTSNTWTHFAFSNDGFATSVMIDGKKVGEFRSESSAFPTRFGVPVETLKLPSDWSIANGRLGIIRSWEINRTEAQINEDKFDFYYTSDLDDVANLKNQWEIPFQGEETTLSGLTSEGFYTISKTNTYLGDLQFSESYVFDYTDITRILKWRTNLFSDTYLYENHELGSGKILLSAQASDHSLFRPGNENQLTIHYPFDADLNIANPEGELGTVKLNYQTGSTFPYDYTLLRSLIDEEGTPLDTIELIASFQPDRVKTVASFGLTEEDVTLDFAASSAASGRTRSYGFQIRLDEKELDEEASLIDFGDMELVANKRSELILKFDNGAATENERFIYSIRRPIWQEIDLVANLDEGILIPFLNGQQLDTVFLTSTFTLDPHMVVKSTLPESIENQRSFELAYLAVHPDALTSEDVAVKLQMLPDLKDDWSLFYYALEDSILRFSTLDDEKILQEDIEVAGLNVIDEIRADLDFINYGNMMTDFELEDVFSSSNVILANSHYQYIVRPNYEDDDNPNLYPENDFDVVGDMATYTLGLSLELVESGSAVKVTWNQELLTGIGYDSVSVYRDGNMLHTVYKFGEYIDRSIARGATHSYTIRPVKNGVEHLSQSDEKGSEPDGVISGHIVSLLEDVIVQEAALVLVNDDQEVNLQSDAYGAFLNDKIFYGISSTFALERVENGSIELTKTRPISEHNFLYTEKNYQFERVSNLIDAENLVIGEHNGNVKLAITQTEEARKLFEEDGIDYYLNVYLNGKLVRILHNENVYIDSLAREPLNDFAFKLYYFKGDKVVLDRYDVEDVPNTPYPNIEGFIANANLGLLVTELNWKYPVSNKIDGFRLYRQLADTDVKSDLISTISYADGEKEGDNVLFHTLDRRGYPGRTYRYELVPFYVNEEGAIVEVELNDEGESNRSNDVLYPLWESLSEIAQLDVDAETITISCQDWLNVAVDYIHVTGGHFEYKIPLKDYTAKTEDIDLDVFTYDFNYALFAEQTLDVQVLLSKSVDEEEGRYIFDTNETGTIASRTNYSIDVNFVGEGYQDKHFVKIAITNTDVSSSPEFYRIQYADVDTLISGNSRFYAFDPTEKFDDYTYEYDMEVYAGYHGNDGEILERISSERLSFSVVENEEGIYEPSNFAASQKGLDRILLKWEYEDFALADFIIYRDGLPLDTIPNDRRSYMDESVELEAGIPYTYQLKAIYNGHTSVYHTAIGIKKSATWLRGVVADAKGRPIPNAIVQVSTATSNHLLITDDLGVYELNTYDYQDGELVELVATVPEKEGFNQVEKTASLIINGKGMYRVNFQLDEVYAFYEQEPTSSDIVSFNYYTDPFNHQLTLRWASLGTDASHYEVRSNRSGLITTVNSLDVLEATTEVNFTSEVTYFIVPVKVDNDGNEYYLSDEQAYQVTVAPFIIAPVEFLVAERDFDKGTVEIYWTHHLENVDGYNISTGADFGIDETMATSFIHEDGIPDDKYRYAITPYVIEGQDQVIVSKSTELITYPGVPKVQNLQAEADNDEYLVNLNWEYPDTKLKIDGVEIYREDTRLGEAEYPTSSFVDKSGSPNTRSAYLVYTLSSVDSLENSVVKKSLAATDTVWYPTVRPVENLTLNNVDHQDTLMVSWEYAADAADYFELYYRDFLNEPDSVLEVIEVTQETIYQYPIRNIVPNTAIRVNVRGVKNINGIEYYADLRFAEELFPAIPAVGDVRIHPVMDNSAYHVSWDYASFNFDSYELKQDEFTVAGDPGVRSFYYTIQDRSLANYRPLFGASVILKDNDGDVLDTPELFSESVQQSDAYNPLGATDLYEGNIMATRNERGFVEITWPVTEASKTRGYDRWEIYRVYHDPENGSTGKDSIVHITAGLAENFKPYNGAKAEETYKDYGAAPGLQYLYYVKGADGNTANNPADFNFLPAIGSAVGQANVYVPVQTEIGGYPMEGLELILKGEILDGFIYKKAVSNEQGLVMFEGLPYVRRDGEKIQYEVIVPWPDEDYSWNESTTFTIPNATSELYLQSINYKKTNIVTGYAKYIGCERCGIDSVSVQLKIYADPGYTNETYNEVALTDQEGKYTIAIPPARPYYYKVTTTPELEGQLNGSVDGEEDDEREEPYIFNPDEQLFSSFDFDENGFYHHDFFDSSALPLKINMTDACEQALGDYQFKVRVADFESKYDTIFVTNDLGELDVIVPPFNLQTSVVGVTNPDAFSVTVLDYFKSKPAYFYYEDELRINKEIYPKEEDPTLITWMENSGITTMKFRQSPEITTDSFVPNKTGSTPDQYVKIGGREILALKANAAEGSLKEVLFKVTDQGCPVTDGFIVVKNPGASKPFDGAIAGDKIDAAALEAEGYASFYDDTNEGYAYTFDPSVPNMQYPYTHLVEVFFYDENASLITSATYEYIVLGEQIIEGSDVFVTPADDKENPQSVNLPTYVLRDPPGDHSYAYLEKGTAFSLSFSSSEKVDDSYSAGISSIFEATYVDNGGANLLIEIGSQNSYTNTITFKTKEKLTTAKTSVLSTNLKGYLDGPDADLILGVGLAYQYGLTDKLVIDQNNHSIKKQTTYNLQPKGISTTWAFTRSAINQTIKYYKSLVEGLGNTDGTGDHEVIEFDGVDPSTSDSEFINDKIIAWEKVLEAIDIDQNPICNMISNYEEYFEGKNESDIVANIADRIDKYFGGIADDYVNNIKANIPLLLEDIKDFYDDYNELKNANPDLNICNAVPQSGHYTDPLTLFNEQSGFDLDFFDKYQRAFESFRKLTILTDYAYNHLSTFYGATNVSFESSSSNLDEYLLEVEEALLNGTEIPSAIDSEYADVDDLRFLASLVVNVGLMEAVYLNYKRTVTKSVNNAISISESAVSDAIKLVDEIDEIARKIDDLSTNVDDLKKSIKALENQGELVGDALEELNSLKNQLTEASNELEKAKKLKITKQVSLDKVKKLIAKGPDEVVKALKSSVKAAKTSGFKRIKNLANWLGAGGLGAIATVIGESVLYFGGYQVITDDTYDRVRKYFAEDLEHIVVMTSNDSDLSSYLGYNGIDNVTFSGGSTIERYYGEAEASLNKNLGTYKAAFDSNFEMGIEYDFLTSVGIGAEVEGENINFKLTAKASFNESTYQEVGSGQEIKAENTIGYVLSDNDDGDQFNVFIINNISSTSSFLSPHFVLVGGRSSDPYEEGTISRDLPTIEIEDRDGTKFPSVYFNQDEDFNVRIPLKIKSGNRFEEGRSVSLSVTPNSNTYGAQYLIGNAEIYTGREISYFLEAGDSLYTDLHVIPTPGTYDYPDLSLVIRPYGVKSDFFADGTDVFDTLEFQVYFKKQPSGVTLNQTNDGPWVINKANAMHTEENYIYYLTNYDVENLISGLQYVKVEYKRNSDDQFSWKPILHTTRRPNGDDFIEVKSDTIGIKELYQFYVDNTRTYVNPTFPFEWDLADYPDVIDGNYIVRATAFDANGNYDVSKVSSYEGVIDRQEPVLADAPSPKDSVYSLGDNVAVSFNESIDYEYFNVHGEAMLTVYDLDGETVLQTFTKSQGGLDFSVVASGGGVDAELGIIPSLYDGHKVSIELEGVRDLYGNEVENLVWGFKLDYFKQSASSVNLVGPDNWVYNLSNDPETEVLGSVLADSLYFIISGYDVYEKASSIQRIDLEVSRAGSGIWEPIASMADNELRNRFDALNNPDLVPEDTLIWCPNTMERYFQDGNYGVRAVVYSDQNQTFFSNTLNGMVDRRAPQLTGIPSPSDQVLRFGERVSFNYDEAIDFESEGIEVLVEAGGEGIDLARYEVQLFTGGVNVIFDEAFMQSFPLSDSIEVTVAGIVDMVGNEAEETSIRFVTDYASNPVSPVSIANLDNWLVNLYSPAELPIVIKDYELFSANHLLDSITVAYRRLQYESSQGNEWQPVITLTKDELIARFENQLEAGDIAIDTVSWYHFLIPDGEYEIQAVAYGGNGFNTSSIKTGRIDRTPPRVFGVPTPVDGILSFNDKAQIDFTETINYNVLGTDALDLNTYIYSSTDTLGFSDYGISVAGSSIEVSISGVYIEQHNGDTLYINVEGIEDLFGNPLYDEALNWSFRLDDQILRPSLVDLIDPEDFIINAENELKEVAFVITNYDLYQFESLLDKVSLQYKRAGETDWLIADELTRAQLVENYEATFDVGNEEAPGEFETLYFDPTVAGIVDGQYEVRAAVFGAGIYSYSNIVSGLIDRKSPSVISVAPSDGIYSLGDEISVSFDESIDVSKPISFEIVGFPELSDAFELGIASDKVVLNPIESLEAYDGASFRISLDNVYDLAANKASSVEWETKIDIFRLAPSSVNIQSPTDFVVNGNAIAANIQVVIDEFALNNTSYVLDSITLEYRSTDTEEIEWIQLTSFDLAELIEANPDPTQLPEVTYSWNTSGLTDGNYAIRAVSHGNEQTRFSSEVHGLADKRVPELVNFAPEHGVYSIGDNIAFTFNEALNSNQLVEVAVRDESGTSLKDDYFVAVQSSDEIAIVPTASLESLDGQEVFVDLINVRDEAGNIRTEVLTRSFLIDYYSKAPSPVELRMSDVLTVNSTSAETQNLLVGGYDLYEFEHSLDRLVLEIRYQGSNEWVEVEEMSRAELELIHTDAEVLPTAYFILPTDELEEGTYEVRVISYGIKDQFTFSNTIEVFVDRVAPEVMGIPEPTNGILDDDEAISVSFSESINLNEVRISVESQATGELVAVDVSKEPSQITITIDEVTRKSLLGDSLTVTIASVADVVGNAMSSQVMWSFIVNSSTIQLSGLEIVEEGVVVNSEMATQPIAFIYRDFDWITSELDSIAFEYKGVTKSIWNSIAQVSLEELEDQVSNIAFPESSFEWKIADEVTDGEYEVRGVVYGYNGKSNISNAVPVTIDRTAPVALSIQPSDTIYEYGDEVAVVFNESIDCVKGITYQVIVQDEQKTMITSLNAICEGGSVVFGSSNEALYDHLGETVNVTINTAYDVYGNVIEEPIAFSFVVGDFKLETSPVRILSPANEWLVNSEGQELEVVLGDYDITASNYALDSLGLEFSPMFENTWTPIAFVTYEELKLKYIETRDVSYAVIWSPSDWGIVSDFYKLRAVAYGNGLENATYSDPIRGEVDMESPVVEEVTTSVNTMTISFNDLLSSKEEAVATVQFNQMVNGISSRSSGKVSEVQAAVNHYTAISKDYYDWEVHEEQVWVNMLSMMRSEFANETVEVFIDDVKDHNGNVSNETVHYTLHLSPIEDDENIGSNLRGTYLGAQQMLLEWQYGGAIEANGFVLERLANTTFDSVTYVAIEEGSDLYSYTDQFNFQDETYYRLRYEGGANIYSRIIRVTTDLAQKEEEFVPVAMITPNPTYDRREIDFMYLTEDYENDMFVRVLNTIGMEIAQRVYTVEELLATSMSIRLDSEVSAGTYFLEITQGEVVTVERIVIK